MQVSLRLHSGCGYTGDAKVSLRLGVARFLRLSRRCASRLARAPEPATMPSEEMHDMANVENLTESIESLRARIHAIRDSL